jgi:hypothetical protein
MYSIIAFINKASNVLIMKILDPTDVSNWFKLCAETGRCLFCACGKEETHIPFCAFEGRTILVNSEDLSKWKEGFFDGLNSERRKKDPRYLIGYKAAQIFKIHQATATSS